MNAERALPAAVAVCCAVAIVLSTGLLVAVEPRAGASDSPDPTPAGVDGVFDPTRVGDTPGHGHFAPTGEPSRLAYTVHTDGRVGAHYYRVAAYDTYTGDGWTRPRDLAPFDDASDDAGVTRADPDASDDAKTVYQHYEVEGRTTAAAAVAAPVAVDGRGDLARSDLGLVAARGLLREGARYDVESRVVRPTPAELRATAGGSVPADVRERYTALPPGTPDVVAARADRIVREAGAETSYGEAAAIERWLEANRAFALRESPDGDVAAGFLTAQSGGYSEQFATTMAVMLRERGVPARYVVGYTPSGTPDPDTGHLWAANAHAWVEVYFPDVGWVRFDPTPAEKRAATEAAAVAAATDDRDPYRPPLDVGSPAEFGGPDYAVDLNRTAVPGASVTATVTEDGDPVVGATVLFHGHEVGTTDRRGRVTGRVPYEETFRIAVRRDLPSPAPAPGDGVDADADADAPLAALSPVGVAAADHDDDERPARAGEAVEAARVPVDTDATVEVLGTPREGQPVRVRATVDGVPLRNGQVAVSEDGDDARRSAETGTDGVATVVLTHADAVRLQARHGPVEGATTVQTAPWVNVSVAGHAMPGREATVIATREGAPVEGALVRVDGRTVGRTGADGRLAVGVPFDNDATITVERGDALGRQSMNWLFAWLVPPVAIALGGLGWGVASLVGVPLVTAGAAGTAPLVVRLGRRLQGAVLAVGNGVRLVVTRAGVAFGNVLAWLGRASTGGVEGVVAGLVGVAAAVSSGLLPWLAGLPGRLRALGPAGVARRLVLAPVAVATGLFGAVTRAPGLFRAWLEAPADGDAGTAAAAADPSPDADDASSRLGLIDAWRAFVSLAPVDARPSRTPGELARAAVAAGVPERPVATLTGLFREVRYGGRDRDGGVDEAARRAFAAVASALGVDADDADDRAADDGGERA